MPLIVVTRLRLKDPSAFEDFFASAVAGVDQARGTEGNLGADALADANNVSWTRTAWQGRGSMESFVPREPHLSTMSRIDEWCDEATFVDWEQDTDDLPDWQTSFSRLITDGQVSSLTDPSEANATRAFPPPVEGR